MVLADLVRRKIARAEARLEAAEQIALARAYAGDFPRERADLEAGRHPLQRRC